MKKRRGVKLVPSLILAMPESSVHEKEVLRLSEQASAGKVVEVTGLLKSREVVPNQFDLFVGLACFVVKGDGWAVGGEVGSGGEFDTESPDCRAVISMRGERPTH